LWTLQRTDLAQIAVVYLKLIGILEKVLLEKM